MKYVTLKDFKPGTLRATINSLNKLCVILIGVDPDFKFEGDKIGARSMPCLKLISADLAAVQTPRMMKALFIDTMNRPYFYDNGNMAFDLHFSYSHHGGGTNGCKIASVEIDCGGNLVSYMHANGTYVKGTL